MVTGQAPVTLELRQKHIKVKSGVSLRCARSIPGAYVSLLVPGKTDYTACHPRKTTTYILHVVSIITHTHDRRQSNFSWEKRNKEQIRRERKGKKREESEKRKRKRKRKKKKRQEKQEKARQEEEARKGKEKKMSY